MQRLSVTIYGRTWVFSPHETVTIGRDPRATMVLDDPAVAPFEVQLCAHEGNWIAHDESGAGFVVGDTTTATIAVDRPITVNIGASGCVDVALALVEAPAAASPATSAVSSLGTQLSALWRSAPSFSTLLPLRSWWESKSWRAGYPLVFLVFALAPVVIDAGTSGTQGISTVVWAYLGVFSALWALLFFTLIRPGKLDLGLLAKVGASSAVIGIPLAQWLERQLPGTDSLPHLILGVGLPEEVAKALPVFVIMVLLANDRPYRTRMFMYMGAISGLSFGAAEGMIYITRFHQQLVTGQMSSASFLGGVVSRLLTDSLWHGCTAIVSGYFIGLATRHLRWRTQLLAFGIGTMAVLHGINDRWASGWTNVAIVASLLFVVIGYVQNGDRIEAEVDAAAAAEKLGASAPASVTAGASCDPNPRASRWDNAATVSY